MQSAKKAAETVKETTANIGASARSGMEKTKATIQEKTERTTAHNPVEKEMATEKKEERIRQAELEKQEAREHNAASKLAAAAPGGYGGDYTSGTGTGTASYSTTGEYGSPMGGHQMSAMPGHGTGHPVGGHVTDETGRTTARNTHEGRNAPHYGSTGGTYS